jgi:prepilin-type N-terminal cleavage/methylation domain-containing protein
MRRQNGFSLMEMLVSMSLMLTVTGAVFTVMNPTQGTFMTEPEVADMQQRMRVATDTLYKDLMMAGGGTYSGQNVGALSYFFAAVMPYRQGRLLDDPPGTFRDDTITLMYVPPTNAQTSISSPMPAQSAELKVNSDPGCPDDKANALCGFETGMSVLIYDDTGSYDQFTITNVQNAALHLQHNMDDLSKSYGPGSKIALVSSHTYYLKTDTATKTYQLMHYDGASSDVPVVDNVVGLQFEYFGDPQPPIMKKALADPTGPWTTYGPKPPPPTVTLPGYPAGENCVFKSDGSPIPASRLLPPVLGPGGTTTTLVQLTALQLTDGPWCPDATNPNRFDADLLRVRKIGVRVRVQTGVDALRGPAGALFTYGGTSRGGNRYLPDQEIRFQVTPRNLNLGR